MTKRRTKKSNPVKRFIRGVKGAKIKRQRKR
jgi:hypothetical protein